MSEAATETTEPEAIELPPSGDAAFQALMDVLAPEVDAPATGEGGAVPAAAATGDGSAAPAAEGAAAAGGAAAAPAGGDGGGTATPDADKAAADAKPTAGAADTTAAAGAAADAAGAGDAGATDTQSGADAVGADAGAGADPASWTTEPAELTPKLGELSTKLEERITTGFQETAVQEVRKEYPKYFDAVQQHPRLLVGTEVPRLDGKEGMETLRDSDDAKEWQEAAKTLLAADVRDRVDKALEENSTYLETLHASIELFQNNVDLIPGVKGFDLELANKFGALAKPYEVRSEDGKLHGYSIPVQPIINQLRTDLAAERAKAPATPSPAAGAQAAAGASTPPAAAEPPQAGIQSKAGNSDEKEDFSTLFGTIGLPNLQI